MPQDRLLWLGLNALARAHELDYFADGHRGASMVAAHLLCVENALDARSRARIEAVVEANWVSTPLCAPFPETTPDPARVDEIGEVLCAGAETLRQVGHNVIFAMLALKAFRLRPEAATPERVMGVCRLIQAFTPWRDVASDPEVSPPAFADGPAASAFILNEACDAVDRFIGFGQGYAGHMLTFGQALVELAAMGHVEWAERCRLAFRKYVTVTRQGPEPGAKPRPDHPWSALRPTEAAYWEKRPLRSIGIGHVFKYPYSCYALLRQVGSDEAARRWEERAHHVF
jgi:hypothetical protein